MKRPRPSSLERGSKTLSTHLDPRFPSHRLKIQSWKSNKSTPSLIIRAMASWRRPYLERDMVISQKDFQFLATIFIPLWPLCIVFSATVSLHDKMRNDFKISLSRIIRLSSATTAGDTHTKILSKSENHVCMATLLSLRMSESLR